MCVQIVRYNSLSYARATFPHEPNQKSFSFCDTPAGSNEPLPAVTRPSNCPQLAKSVQSSRSNVKVALVVPNASAPFGVGGILLLPVVL